PGGRRRGRAGGGGDAGRTLERTALGAYPGKVDTGFPERICANARIQSAARFLPIGLHSRRSGPACCSALTGYGTGHSLRPRGEWSKAMKILVPVKRVVDYNVKIRVKTDGSGVELANVKM